MQSIAGKFVWDTHSVYLTQWPNGQSCSMFVDSAVFTPTSLYVIYWIVVQPAVHDCCCPEYLRTAVGNAHMEVLSVTLLSCICCITICSVANVSAHLT